MTLNKLQETAIAAYKESKLWRKDAKQNALASALIKTLIGKFGVNVEVDSNPYECDGLRFYVEPLRDDSGIFGQRILISRKCPQCGERLVTETRDYSRDHALSEFDMAAFGRWLLSEHLCEFDTGKGKVGFV